MFRVFGLIFELYMSEIDCSVLNSHNCSVLYIASFVKGHWFEPNRRIHYPKLRNMAHSLSFECFHFFQRS